MKKHLYKCLVLGLYLSLAMPLTSFAAVAEQAIQSLAINESGEYVVYTYDELAEAIELASDGDTIVIEQDIDIFEPISINKSLFIKSASGNIGLNSSSSYFFILGDNDLATFSELTLMDIELRGSWNSDAILVNYGRVNLENTYAHGFNAVCILNDSPEVTVNINGGTFENNVYVISGHGSINIYDGNFHNNQRVIDNNIYKQTRMEDHGINISGGTFSHNGNGDRGGVIYSDLPVTISGGTFMENRSTYGGVIYSKYITITGGEFFNNHADYGGVIYTEHAVVKIYDGNMNGNTALNDGGVMYIEQFGTVEIFGGTMEGNAASGLGGVVYIRDQEATLEINGGMMCGNSASSGGAISANINNLIIRDNAVISNNHADQAYYVVSQEDILLHEQQITSTVTWTEGFDYIYNNLDVAYTEGSLTAPTYTITFVILYNDDVLPESSQIYEVEPGGRLEANFNFIQGSSVCDVQIDNWEQDWYFQGWGDGEAEYLDVILEQAIGDCIITIFVELIEQ